MAKEPSSSLATGITHPESHQHCLSPVCLGACGRHSLSQASLSPPVQPRAPPARLPRGLAHQWPLVSWPQCLLACSFLPVPLQERQSLPGPPELPRSLDSRARGGPAPWLLLLLVPLPLTLLMPVILYPGLPSFLPAKCAAARPHHPPSPRRPHLPPHPSRPLRLGTGALHTSL